MIFLVVITILSIMLFLSFRQKLQLKANLNTLGERIDAISIEESTLDDLINAETSFDYLSDRLGKAGFLSKEQRLKFKNICYYIFFIVVSLFIFAGLIFFNLKNALILFIIATYISLTSILIFLKLKAKSEERECLFQLAIFLESLILLVESGLGILPALEKIVKTQEVSGSKGTLSYLFNLIYKLTENGLPFSKSLSLITEATPLSTLKHIFMHLDISNSEGGELIPALRNLSDYAHNEWKLSVEYRVRRLENIVVFPVFLSVIGLMILSSAVPVIPLLKLKDSLNQRQQTFSSELNISNEFNNFQR